MINKYTFDEIYIQHAIDDDPDDLDFKMHIHEKCEIYFLVSGNVKYLVEGSKYSLNENDLMIMRPAESHKPQIMSADRYERYVINFPVTFADRIDPERTLLRAFTERSLGKNNMFSSSEIDMNLVKKLFSEMFSDIDEYNRHLTITTHLLMLLDMIDRAYSDNKKEPNKPQSIGEQIVIYVNNNLFENISVPSLAKHFYLSPSQFSRVFKQSTGVAPWKYITKKRLTAAKEKIRSGCSAQNACEECGFRDYSAFYRVYVKHFGCAPKENFSNIK